MHEISVLRRIVGIEACLVSFYLKRIGFSRILTVLPCKSFGKRYDNVLEPISKILYLCLKCRF
ncbi:hypothetical protein LEP1GSC171_2637 [Leptospira santarosai str. HAI1380]|nr:hypothetical protein LEP1GSC171_2637 [Leptospira santarosai str. HAI1380]